MGNFHIFADFFQNVLIRNQLTFLKAQRKKFAKFTQPNEAIFRTLQFSQKLHAKLTKLLDNAVACMYINAYTNAHAHRHEHTNTHGPHSACEARKTTGRRGCVNAACLRRCGP